MPAGRPRKPLAELKLTGSEYAKGREDTEPQPPIGTPPQPDWLSDDAKVEWRRLVGELVKTPELLTTADGEALAELAASRVRCIALYQWLEENESTDRGSTGQPITHPKLKEYENERRHMLGLLIQFGLTPAARSRVVVANPKPKSEKARFFGT